MVDNQHKQNKELSKQEDKKKEKNDELGTFKKNEFEKENERLTELGKDGFKKEIKMKLDQAKSDKILIKFLLQHVPEQLEPYDIMKG